MRQNILGVFAPHREIAEANFRRFQWFSPRFSSTYNPLRPIFCHFQSVSVSFNQLQSILISFNQFDSAKTQQFIDNRKVGKTTLKTCLLVWWGCSRLLWRWSIGEKDRRGGTSTSVKASVDCFALILYSLMSESMMAIIA